MADSAWIGVVGALGGVAITGIIGLGTAALTRRWSTSDRVLDRADARLALRREAYVRYLVAYEALTNSILGNALDATWRGQHGSLAVLEWGIALRNADSKTFDEYDAAKNQAQLVAGDSVRAAVEDTDDKLASFVAWLALSKPTDASEIAPNMPNASELITAMRGESAADA